MIACSNLPNNLDFLESLKTLQGIRVSSKMIIINQLFRFSHAIIESYPWIIFLIDPAYHFGYFLIMGCMGAVSSWFQIIVGTIVGFLVANLVLSISSTIPSSFQSVKRTFQGQQSQPLITSEYKSVDIFLESIESYPQPSKSKPSKSNNPKPSLSDLDSWTKEMQQQQQQQQAENGYHNDDIINTSETLDDDDDDPGETSLFAENYITESEHNKALASLDYQIGRLIKQISKRDQLLQKSRVETIQAETMINQLQVEIKGLKADLEAKNKIIIIKELQVLHDGKKEKLLINELHAPPVSELTEGFPKDEVDFSSHCIDQETTPSEGKQKAKDIMTYIPPNRRPLRQAY